MILNTNIYLCLFIVYLAAYPTFGKSLNDSSSPKKDGKREKVPLYHEITNRKPSQLAENNHSVEVNKVQAHDVLAMTQIVGEVLEQNVEHTNVNHQDETPESEQLIHVTSATPRKVKNSKKSKHQKSKKSDMKKKQKKKLNKTAKKRKYPKKYNAKKHGLKKLKDKKHFKTKSKKQKRTKKANTISE